ncbi:UbiX family flavin prenyltransferase [uncultured Fibrobacter sp.]|uniref:UbiX family flavin prenyltransferase n=1 Tax=uncultured Fibrobacter sp. TaxID=261512 RepID=UPI00280417E2|nr:UbiX family flavin prenyltransferase [uncultured Fibrobacter sp.]
MSHFVLGVTGASGTIYAARTLWHLQKMGHSVTLIQTTAGKTVAHYEGMSEALNQADAILNVDDFFAGCASGNSHFAGMAIVPCSMGSLGKIANGIADNLLTRTADVCLKERRPLVVVPREMPYNLIHIKNMERLTLAGAVVIPASPHFYSHAATIENLVDTVVSKILRHLNVPNQIVPEWGSAK